jgi:hypothetical protein
VGPIQPTYFSRTRHCPQPEARPVGAGGPTTVGGPPIGEVERVLRQVERNLTTLSLSIPMVDIEDIPPYM